MQKITEYIIKIIWILYQQTFLTSMFKLNSLAWKMLNKHLNFGFYSEDEGQFECILLFERFGAGYNMQN